MQRDSEGPFPYLPYYTATQGDRTFSYSPGTIFQEDNSGALFMTGLVGGGISVTRKQFTARQRRRKMASKSSSRGKGSEKSPTPPEKGDTMRLARRKACDLCFNKKIKCDMLKPQCSNCEMYHAECKTTMIRRKSAAPKERSSTGSPASASPPAQHESRESLESRLARIESQLQQVLSMEVASKDRLGSASSVSPNRHPSSMSPSYQHTALCHGPGSMPHSWTITPTQQGFYEQLPEENLTVPPLEEVAHVIDHFFNDFNTVTPLFCCASFMIMLRNFYNDPLSRNKGSWAAIQIVIAIGYRTPLGDSMPHGAERAYRSNAHLRSAQSVISHLATREEDMLGVQVLLGIVILFLNSSDFQPAAVMTGNAARLAYRLGLHERESPKHGAAVEAEQRARVFWIAYYLDRSLSLRTKTPPTIVDDDVDVPPPPLKSRDGTGLIWIPGGNNHINYFRCQVDLAHIQGKVFELLHSTRGAKIRGSERDQRVRHLQSLLERWYNQIPPLFQIENLVSTSEPIGVMRLTRMFHEYQLAVLNLHSVYNTQDAEWVHQLSTASAVDAQNFSAMFQQLMTPCSWGYPPPSREGWEECVAVSRACMKLFHNAFPGENIVWHCVCSLYAGTLVLLTNILLHPGHPLATLDQYICTKSMALFERVEPNVGGGDRNALKNTTRELMRKASVALEGLRTGSNTSVSSAEPLGGGSQQLLMKSFDSSLVSTAAAHQGFDMSMLATHGTLFDNPVRQVEFGGGLHSFNPDDMDGLGIPTTQSMANIPDCTGYNGGQ